MAQESKIELTKDQQAAWNKLDEKEQARLLAHLKNPNPELAAAYTQHETDRLEFKGFWDEFLPSFIKGSILEMLRAEVAGTDFSTFVARIEQHEKEKPANLNYFHLHQSSAIGSVLKMTEEELWGKGDFLPGAEGFPWPVAEPVKTRSFEAFFAAMDRLNSDQDPLQRLFYKDIFGCEYIHEYFPTLNALEFVNIYQFLWNMACIQTNNKWSDDDAKRQKQINCVKYAYLLQTAIAKDDAMLLDYLLSETHLHFKIWPSLYPRIIMTFVFKQAVLAKSGYVINACLKYDIDINQPVDTNIGEPELVIGWHGVFACPLDSVNTLEYILETWATSPTPETLKICYQLLNCAKDPKNILLATFARLVKAGKKEEAKRLFKKFNICPNGYYRYKAENHPMVVAIKAVDPDTLKMLLDAGGDLNLILSYGGQLDSLMRNYELNVEDSDELDSNRRVVECFKLLAERGFDRELYFDNHYQTLCDKITETVAHGNYRGEAEATITAFRTEALASLATLGRRPKPGKFEQWTMVIIGVFVGLIYGILMLPFTIGRILTSCHRYWRRDVFKAVIDPDSSLFRNFLRMSAHVALLLFVPLFTIFMFTTFPIIGFYTGVRDGWYEGIATFNVKRHIAQAESALGYITDCVYGDLMTGIDTDKVRLNILALDRRVSTYVWSVCLGAALLFHFVIPGISISVLPAGLVHLLPAFIRTFQTAAEFQVGQLVNAGFNLFMTISLLVVGRLVSWFIKGVEYIVKTPAVGKTTAEETKEEGARPTYEILSAELGITQDKRVSGSSVSEPSPLTPLPKGEGNHTMNVGVLTPPLTGGQASRASQPGDGYGDQHPTSRETPLEGGYTHTVQK